ncbi:MAG: hypothetical protein GQ527_05610, partial [Bacteroidales bacterium]|nr:hypothetical protein [Bacteroidales bacterium]
MNKVTYKQILYIFLFFIGWIWSSQAIAQEEYSSTEEMAIGAQTLFEQEQYVRAFPLYSQLLSLNRTDPELNYRFGVCLLYSDRSDTYAPISYLKKALNHISDPEIYYHLGFAYHINYYFPAAISLYEEYKVKAGKKAKKSFDVERKIEMCRNGMNMMRSVKDLFVLQKSEVSRMEFFRSYDLQDFGSRIISKPEEFVNKEDNGHRDFIFFNPKAKVIYYSALSKSNRKHKDIFRRYKTPEGKWSSAEKLSEIINTPYDEDFPVMMPDGKTLYFSSRGHTTIGGFDIFKSVFNDQTKLWSEPENVNFPFNTPLDDILFISDTLESTAWFASVRNSVDEKIMVYKVGIIKRPEGSADLAAIYAKNQQLTEEDLRLIKERARLDVNITSDEYEEIPVIEAAIVSTGINQGEGAKKLAEELEQKKQQQEILDSAMAYVNHVEANISAFDSIKQRVTNLASSKRLESMRLSEEVKRNLKIVAGAKEIATLEKMIKESNMMLAKSEKLAFEAAELDLISMNIKDDIKEQQTLYHQLHQQYGDAQGAIIEGDNDAAKSILLEMENLTTDIPVIADLDSELDITSGDLKNVQYPQELVNPAAFVALVLSINETEGPQIASFSAEYDEYLPVKEEELDGIEEKDSYSDNPSAKVEEYIAVLNQK